MRRVRAIVLSAAALCGIAFAADTFEVKGRVIDAATGKPIERARVTAQLFDLGMNRSVPLIALTDQQGVFEFTNVPQGSARFWTEKTGYLGGASRSDSSVNWFAPRNAPILFSLTQQAVIEGKILDENGIGVKSRVSLWRQNPQSGRIEILPNNNGVLWEADKFRFYGLEAGGYFVEAANSFGPMDVTYPAVFYPNARDWASAKLIVVEPGQEAHVEFHLKEVPAYKISGRFAGGSGNVSISVNVFDFPGFGGNGIVSFDEKAQTFEIRRVPSGTYILEITRFTPDGRQSRASQKVVIDDRNVDGITIDLPDATSRN